MTTVRDKNGRFSKGTESTEPISRRIRVGGQLVDYDDAQEPVSLERTLADVLKARPGDDGECMNSICIKAQRNGKAFPHPVYAVSTVKSRVYIVDEIGITKKGEIKFLHAVRYEISPRESKLIEEHDTLGTGEPGMLNLRVPRDPKGSVHRARSGGGYAAGRGRDDRRYTGKRNHGLTGSIARYKVAVGALNFPEDGVV